MITSPLDTFRGLPVHVLALHLTVVLVPVAAVVTAAVPWRAVWRQRFAWPVAVLDAFVVGLVLVTQESGEKLQDRLPSSPLIEEHAELGGQLIWFTVAVLVAAVLVALLRSRAGGLATGVGLLSVAVAAASIVWVVRIGEAGSSAVWKTTVASTNQR